MAVPMRCYQQQPLIAIEFAEGTVSEKVLPGIALRVCSEIDAPLSGRLELWDELIVGPAVGGMNRFRRLARIGAVGDDLQKFVVATVERAALCRFDGLLQRARHAV